MLAIEKMVNKTYRSWWIKLYPVKENKKIFFEID
jgi:hypothetical protein